VTCAAAAWKLPHARDGDCKVAVAMADEPEPRTRIEHPNRRKAASRVTRLLVVVLLLISAALVLIVTVGGWSTLQGAKALQVGYILVYLLLAFFVARWSRGVLPVIAALAIVLLIFAVVSVPGWYDRDQAGFTDPGLPSDVLGLVTALIVPVQLLLIAVSLSGFRQAWNVEIERRVDDDRPREPQRDRGPSPAPA
jgi:peptidoglycan/LPS O-acetylase OafA/YrhL